MIVPTIEIDPDDLPETWWDIIDEYITDKYDYDYRPVCYGTKNVKIILEDVELEKIE